MGRAEVSGGGGVDASKNPRGKIMRRLAALGLALFAYPIAAIAQAPLPHRAPLPHNIVLFVPDGLRALSVTLDSAPTMAAVRDKGVNFMNSHSLSSTCTTSNVAATATSHHICT